VKKELDKTTTSRTKREIEKLYTKLESYLVYFLSEFNGGD
jgi:hypothetical protein